MGRYVYSIEKRVLHFREPAGTSRGVYTIRTVWFVTLRHGDRVGIGECAPLPRLSCDDLPDYEAILERMCRETAERGEIDYERLRPYPSILFGLECAMRMLNPPTKLPQGEQLFLQGKTGIPINGLIWMGTYQVMRQRIETKLRDGYRCIKLKIGAIDFADEQRLLQLIRQEYDADKVTLRVDANGAFPVADAPRRLRQLAELDLHSIEQPIRQGQWQEMARLCADTPLPIALDEELIGVNQPDRKRQLLDTIRPQYIILKPSLHGGIQGCEEWIRLALERGIGWWATSALESNVGLTAIARWCAGHNPTIPQGLGTGLLYTDNTPSHTSPCAGILSYHE